MIKHSLFNALRYRHHNALFQNAKLAKNHQIVKSLRDSRISWGGTLSVINLSYNLNKWQFEAGVIMPFGKYDRGSKSLNKWNTNEQHIRLDMRIPYIQISYNLQWGRQKRNTDKLISTGAETDRSSAAGR